MFTFCNWSLVYYLQIGTITALQHAAINGETVVLLQADEIQESFYDLFNQRFTSVDTPQGNKIYYAHVAIGAQVKPCRVDPKFQCIIIVKESEVSNPNATPPPFLNRFEKYKLSHKTLVENVLANQSNNFKELLEDVMKKVDLMCVCYLILSL